MQIPKLSPASVSPPVPVTVPPEISTLPIPLMPALYWIFAPARGPPLPTTVPPLIVSMSLQAMPQLYSPVPPMPVTSPSEMATFLKEKIPQLALVPAPIASPATAITVPSVMVRKPSILMPQLYHPLQTAFPALAVTVPPLIVTLLLAAEALV